MTLIFRFDKIITWWWFKKYARFARRHRALHTILYPLIILAYFTVTGWLGIIQILVDVVEKVFSRCGIKVRHND